MVAIALIKTGKHFIPSLSDDNERVKRIPEGTIIEVKFSKRRNGKFHRKCFALLNVIFANQDQYENIDHLREAMLIEGGFCKTVITLDGKVNYIPESMSYDQMDDIRFSEVYQKFIDIAIRRFAIGKDEQEMERAVLEYLRFA